LYDTGITCQQKEFALARKKAGTNSTGATGQTTSGSRSASTRGKAASKKSGAKKAAGKAASKKSGAKKAAGKAASKKSGAKKAAGKVASKKSGTKKAAGKVASKKSGTKKADGKSASRKAGTKKANAKKDPVAQAIEEAALATDRTGTEDGEWSDEKLRKVKTGLRARDIEHFRKRLLAKRAELLGDYESLKNDVSDPGGGGLSHMPLHMADVGSDNYEHEFTLGLMESERRMLNEIDDALLRLARQTYGVCLVKGVPIGKARLEAKPWAKYCIEAVRELEAQGKL